jgi:hypothetical protein
LTGLVKQVDAAAVRHSGAKVGSYAVFCSADEKLEARLKELGEQEKLRKVVLAIDHPKGPEGYDLAPDADVTVLLYVKGKVKANHAFKKGEFTAEAAKKVLDDLAKILPEPG